MATESAQVIARRNPKQGGIQAGRPAVMQLDRGRPLRAQIYEYIRQQILTGLLQPGDSVDEKAIAIKLGVSRTPVREAVKKLSDENLIAVKAQSATTVARIDRRLIHEAFLIRRALEVEGIAHAAARMRPSSLTRLAAIQQRHAQALSKRQFVAAITLDDQFHQAISSIADLPHLWRAVEVSKAHLDRCRHLTLPQDGAGSATLTQHQAIIDALAAGDAAASRTAMAVHLESAYQGIVAFLDQIDELELSRS